MHWHRKLNATIGYSNPSKMTFRTACNIIVGKIFAEIRIRYAQRGITLALLIRLVIGIVTMRRWHFNSLIYRCTNNTGRIQ